MKTILIIITLLFSFNAMATYIEYSELVKRDNLYYEKFTDVPYSGNVKGKARGKLINSIRDGEWKDYYDSLATKFVHDSGPLATQLSQFSEPAKGTPKSINFMLYFPISDVGAQ